MNPMWLLRMKRWAQNPPSMRKVIFVLAILGVCFALYAIETWIGWPDWATPNRGGGPRMIRP